MTIQKCLKYKSVDITGKLVKNNNELKVNILEASGNYLLHKDLLRHLSSQKQGTSSTKTRSEVRGGGKKPWRQKGTGRARAGSNRSPLWKGGGVIFGPKPRKTFLKSNKKERKLALQTLLYNKKNNIILIENLEEQLKIGKTKQFLQICKDCQIQLTKDQRLLVVTGQKTPELKLSTKNLPNVELISASNLNTFSLLKAKKIILTSLAVKDIKEIYCD